MSSTFKIFCTVFLGAILIVSSFSAGVHLGIAMQAYAGGQLNEEENETKKTSDGKFAEEVAKNEKDDSRDAEEKKPEQVQDSLGNNLLNVEEKQPEQVYDSLGNNLLN